MSDPSAAARSAAETAPTARDPDLQLARLHLRSGGLALARAELEALAGTGALDDDGLLDLAEARWRTGDLIGAGDVAQTYLDTGGRSVVATVIAAEAMAALGRPSEARRFVADAIERSDGSLDPVFAGMPKLAPWPFDVTHATGEPVGSIFGDEGVPARPAGEAAVGMIGMWGDEVPADALESMVRGPELADAATELAAGDLDRAAVRLGLLLRADPGAAGAVLAAIGDRRSPALDLVRGDALRMAGDEPEARRAYSSAVGAFRAGGHSGQPAGVSDEEGSQPGEAGPVADPSW